MGDYAKGEDVDPEGINFKRLFAYANYLIKTDQEIGKAEAAQLFRGIKEKRKAMQEILGKEFVTWENLIPDGYTEWQPREGSLMFLTESIPAQLAEKLRQGMLESLEITEKRFTEGSGSRRTKGTVCHTRRDCLDPGQPPKTSTKILVL